MEQQQQKQQQEKEARAMTTTSRLDATNQCALWIAELSTDSSSAVPFDRGEDAAIEFRHSSLSNNVGVFARKDIAEGKVLLRLPLENCLRESHPMVQSSPAVTSLVDKVMIAYDSFVNARAESISPNDLCYPNKGRVLGQREIRMMVLVAILLYAADALDTRSQEDTGDDTLAVEQQFSSMDTALSSELVKLAKYWSAFLKTWPRTFSSLPMFWTKSEMDNIRGTSHHAYVTRLRQDVDEQWLFVIQPALQGAGFCIPKTLPATNDDGTNMAFPLFYERAVGATYSRSHGAFKRGLDSLMSLFESVLAGVAGKMAPPSAQQQHLLCPLLDCVNGARDDEDINVEMSSDDDEELELMELKSIRRIKSGEELILSYGNVPNQNYL